MVFKFGNLAKAKDNIHKPSYFLNVGGQSPLFLVESMRIDEYLDKVEKRIYSKGKLLSTWYSSSRQARLGEAKADLLVRGNMAVKGFLLSRIGRVAVPAWETLAVVFSPRGEDNPSVQQLEKMVASTEQYMSKNSIKWSWLAYVSEKGFDTVTIDFVRNRLKKEIGIMLIDLSSKSFVCNNVKVNQYGKRVFKL
jgi:hypothetical protein